MGGLRMIGSRTGVRRAVAVVAAAAVVLSGCASDDGDEVQDLSGELAAAVERAEVAEAERDELAAQLEEVGDGDSDELDELSAALEAAEVELVEARVEVEALTERAETAEARVAEVEEIVGQFPIALDSSLIPDDMPGNYRIRFSEAYCDGFSTCGTPLGDTTASIYFTSERFLRVGVDGILDAGLFALNGSLYGITDSFTAIPPCGETQRRARITVTLYAGSIAVLEDGTRVVNDLNASITIDAPAEGPDCPSGLVFYSSSLTPAG